ncbi:enoyl-CoA hydratase/isomerase family protein [Nocardioides sp. LHD-245]|uniref:enoyl-CoA hydratase/isomerase family protein n=1 Tax=Nocardioides sp. LHD-245 TaxID=3051387 RepID=UPI0027E0D964|nr:enoyl-CoA hydratase/isomerase family protein [Nocardioides sp. LHD-245]
MPTLLVTRPLDGVVQLTLDRPERLNALDAELVGALHAELDRIRTDRTCRVVVLTGAGRAFCAGLDLQGYDDGRSSDADPISVLDRQREIAALTEKIHLLPQPVVAAVNGPAAGGGLALVCAADVRIAAEEAIFKVSFITAGYSACDIGVSWLLPRIVGAGNAHELMLTGRRFDAEEADRIGLVVRVTGAEELLDAALATAGQILGNGPVQVELTKQGMWLALEMPSLRAGIELENRQQVITALTRDQKEATAAFLEKRTPTFERR